MRCCCFEVVWPSGEGLHLETTRRELEPPPSSIIILPPPLSVTFIWSSLRISDGTTPEKGKNGVFKVSPEILTPLHPQCESSVLHPPATAATSSWRTDSETAVSLRAASREQLLLLFKKQLFQTASPSSPSLPSSYVKLALCCAQVHM